MAATDKDVLRPAQISTNYQAGARALVIAAEGFDSVTDNGVVGMPMKSSDPSAVFWRDVCHG